MSDIVLGVIGLVVLLAAALGIGLVYYRFKQARFVRAWAPLIELVNGRVRDSEGGSDSSWLSGTYQGRPIEAAMIPGRNVHATTSGSDDAGGWTYNYFDVALTGVTGAHDWRVECTRSALNRGQQGWNVVAGAPALQAALEQAGIISLVAALGEPPSHWQMPVVEYSHQRRTLRYQADAGKGWLPTKERLRAQLDLLLKLDDLNRQLNAPASGVSSSR